MSESKCHTCTKVCFFRDAVCPVCLGTLMLEEDGHKYGCCDCYFGCNLEDLPRIAAAMELAKAEVAASNAVWSVPLERLEPAVEAAEAVLFQAKMRVLEVFR